MDADDLRNRFKYHPPRTERRRKEHEAVRDRALGFADFINEVLPEGREKSLAVTKVEEAMMWANAGLARQPDES